MAEFRINHHAGDKTSVLGFGAGHLAVVGKSAVDVLCCTYEGSILYRTYEYFQQVLENVRKNIVSQAHFGSRYRNKACIWITKGDDSNSLWSNGLEWL